MEKVNFIGNLMIHNNCSYFYTVNACLVVLIFQTHYFKNYLWRKFIEFNNSRICVEKLSTITINLFFKAIYITVKVCSRNYSITS